MDLKSSEGDGSGIVNENADKPPENPNSNKKSLVSNGTDVGNMSAKNMYMRGDKIDFLKWDAILENRLSRVLSRDTETNTNTNTN
ncbi:hypothetical protein KSS87_012624, partial [Heliosperma pusillum]